MSKRSTGSTPNHIGFILDGNRRWARSKGLPTFEGHRIGFDNLEGIAKAAFDRGVKFVSAYIFSVENWNRSSEEVDYLMRLASRMIKKYQKKLKEDNIKVVWLGSRDRVSNKLLRELEKTEAETKDNTGGTLCLCFNYGGHKELLEAVKKLAAKGLSPQDISQEVLESALYAPDVPQVDFLIRTSGEKRISNFMLYRISYSELYFIEKHWPDFTKDDLKVALDEYATRKRRFGG